MSQIFLNLWTFISYFSLHGLRIFWEVLGDAAETHSPWLPESDWDQSTDGGKEGSPLGPHPGGFRRLTSGSHCSILQIRGIPWFSQSIDPTGLHRSLGSTNLAGRHGARRQSRGPRRRRRERRRAFQPEEIAWPGRSGARRQGCIPDCSKCQTEGRVPRPAGPRNPLEATGPWRPRDTSPAMSPASGTTPGT